MLQHLARAVLLRYKSHLFTPVFSSYLIHLRTTNLTHGDLCDLGLVLSASVCVFLIMQSSSQFLKVAGFTYAVSSAQNFSHLGLPAKYPPTPTNTHTLSPVDPSNTAPWQNTLYAQPRQGFLPCPHIPPEFQSHSTYLSCQFFIHPLFPRVHKFYPGRLSVPFDLLLAVFAAWQVLNKYLTE